MGKLVVAFPFYRQLSVHWFFNFLMGMDLSPVVDYVGVDGTFLPMAMKKLVDMALQRCPDLDRLVFFEHDVLPPTDAFLRIAAYDDSYDIVAGMMFRHQSPYHVYACMETGFGGFSPLTAETTRMMAEKPDLYEVDLVSMGFTSVHRRVLERWDPDVFMWMPSPPIVGHDLHFCTEAKRQGFRVWLDSGIRCGHLTLVPIGFEESQDDLARHPPAPEVWRGHGL